MLGYPGNRAQMLSEWWAAAIPPNQKETIFGYETIGRSEPFAPPPPQDLLKAHGSAPGVVGVYMVCGGIATNACYRLKRSIA